MIFSSPFMEPDVTPASHKPKRSLSDEDTKLVNPFGSGAGDGSSVELPKRPRGRPPGSKNKPKPPVYITRESDPVSAMRPHVLEISPGHDLVDSLSAFSRRRRLGICVLAATGAVSNVTLRQPPHPTSADVAADAGTVGIRGRFEILSMSATFFPAGMGLPAPAVTVSLAGPQGQVLGGTAVGPVMAAGTVMLVVAGFENPSFHRLPVEDHDVSVSVSVSVSPSADREDPEEGYGHRVLYRPQPQRESGDDVAAAAQVESCGMAMYSTSHFATEGMWGTAARPPHRPPPPY